MAKVWVIQHHLVENLGTITEALSSAALAWQYVRVFQDQSVPRDMKGAGGLIVMGGPMSVNHEDRLPTLKAEIALVRDALERGLPVMGVCLGAQILAVALGAKVTRNSAREIGWHPVKLEPAAADDPLFSGLPPSFTAFHWHSEIFDLPRGAANLASSEKSPCQAFRYGPNAYGLQFHLELTAKGIAGMAAAWPGELAKEKIPVEDLTGKASQYLPGLEALSETVFGRWARPIQGT